MQRLAMLGSFVAALLLLSGAQEVAARRATSKARGPADAESDHGVSLMQLSFARLFHRGILLLTSKPDGQHTVVNTTAHANATTDTFEDAVPAMVPPAVPLSIKVQDTAKNGTETVLVGPAWNLLMELHVPMRLRDLHTGKYGPMRKFLDTLTKELVATGPMSESRLVMLDVRGENRNFSLHSLDLLELGLISFPSDNKTSKTSEGGDVEAAVSADTDSNSQETIVDIEVLPMQHPGDASSDELFAVWQADIADKNSKLRQGRLSAPLTGATLVRVGPPLSADGSENRWGTIIRSSAQGPRHGVWSILAFVVMASTFSL
eukprot:CAMPEP_0171238850 /NCGR_PEP_ID=MMETSP0790-20130122/43680_1 /TAXON_ID=2925 /ORGANISM="Alexandrium catenella, Strain OF101" /LENGTH=318 /DNA_ID=CAMNT_0011705217 /DNA_START=141 /DNA_END=1100 /DNA_ORIENTATION=+